MRVFEKHVLPLFGVLGTLITTLTFVFPQYANVQVKLPIYVSTILILLFICSIFIKLFLDTKKHINDNVYFNNFTLKPIQFVPNENILLFERTIDIPLSTAVSIFIKIGLFESILAIGYVFHVQEKILQIKLLFPDNNLNTLLSEDSNLNRIIVHPASNIHNIVDHIPRGVKQ